MKKKFKDLNHVIDEILKSQEASKLDDEDLEAEDEEENYEIEDETEDVEDVDKSEDTEDVEDEKEDVNKEEDEEAEDEDDSEYMELDEVTEEVTNRIMANVKDYIEELLDNKLASVKENEEDIKGLSEVVDKSLKIIKNLDREISRASEREAREDVIKSLRNKVDDMDRLMKSRRSFTNNKELDLVERFQKSMSIEDLSNKERAEILSRQYQAGNTNINLSDITNAELGKSLSPNAINILEKSINM